MADVAQNYQNHLRWHPPFHFFVAPVMLINFIWSVVVFFRDPSWEQGRWSVVSFAFIVLTLLARINPLRAQDRIIRLEERLRYQRLLPADVAERAGSLPIGQIVALRFASDAELPELVQKVLAKQLSKPGEIKQAVKSWRADTYRV